MQRLNSNEYEITAELMRGFLEEIEFVPYDDLPSVKNIVKELKRTKYVENGITAQHLECKSDGDQVVFVYYDRNRSWKELFQLMETPLEKGAPVSCYVVVFVKTMEEKQQVDSQKAEINEIIKNWLTNRKDGRQRSRVRFCTLHIPTDAEKSFPIAIRSRIRTLHYDANLDKAKVSSAVYIAKLFDVVSMYNCIGTKLFVRNVRYHIKDVLNVESEIQSTLATNPSDFFNYNNGIAIQIKTSKGLDCRDEKSIRLTYSQAEDISVINGAQTISAAADFFFQQSADTQIQAAIETAKKDAWVLLRIFYPANTTKEDCTSSFDQISISLNRQKPIAPIDIEYTRPEVILINSLFEKHRGDPHYFKVLKRGQEEPGRFQYQLSDFGRIVTAYYYNNPAAARSNSTQDIVMYSPTSDNPDMLKDEDQEHRSIYAPFATTSNLESLFMKWYKPVNFAIEIAKAYSQTEKKYRKKEDIDDNVLATLGNGRYFFVAYVVNMLNNSLTRPKQPLSFSDFNYSTEETSEDEMEELIKEYAKLVAQFAAVYFKQTEAERNTLTSNDFKTEAFYKAWCTYADDDKNEDISKWKQNFQSVLLIEKN